MRIRNMTISLVSSTAGVLLLVLLLPWHTVANEPSRFAAPPSVPLVDPSTIWRTGGPYLSDGVTLTPTVTLDLAASPAYADDLTLFTATRSGIYRTADGGTTWQLVLPPPVGAPEGYFSHIRLANSYGTDGVAVAAYAATASGPGTLYQSNDSGATWQPISTFTTTVRALALSPAFTTDQTIFALIGDGTALQKSTDGGQSWQSYHIGPEAIFNGSHLAVSPDYATDNTLFTTGYGTVHRSTDGGETWMALDTYGITFGLAHSPDYGTDRSLWATYRFIESPGDGTPENSVMRSVDGGDTWTPLAMGLPGNYEPFARILAVSPTFADNHSLFTALSGQLLASPDHVLLRSYDGGASWVDLGAPPDNPDILALAVTERPGEGIVAHVATEKGVWHYSNPCEQYVVNHHFEYPSGWDFPHTAHQATYSTDQAYSGVHSARTGIATPADNRLSYSSVQQLVAIPRDALSVTLSLQWYPLSGEGNLDVSSAATLRAAESLSTISGDRQYILLLDENNRILERLLWTRRDRDAWEALSFDVSAYAGRTIRLHLGVYNDGLDGATAMYIDDVTVTATCARCSLYLPIVCHELTPPSPTPTATPTVTPLPTATSTPTATPTPVSTPIPTPIWPTPPTAIELFSPLPNELYRSPIDINGFARTFEGNVYLKLTAADGTVLAQYRTRAGMTDYAFFRGYLRFEITEETNATLSVYEAATADQTPITVVEVPLRLERGQRLIDLNMPTPGSKICGRVPIGGYSNTFEANVVVELTTRSGTQLEQAFTMGGNLGIYGEFATYFEHTVTAPQAVLVGAYEVSPRDGSLIDHSRVPVSLYPASDDACP